MLELQHILVLALESVVSNNASDNLAVLNDTNLACSNDDPFGPMRYGDPDSF